MSESQSTYTAAPKRPDYVKCVRRSAPSSGTPGKTLCGRNFWSFEWTFQDVEHALQNEEQGGRLVTCPECAAAIRGPAR